MSNLFSEGNKVIFWVTAWWPWSVPGLPEKGIRTFSARMKLLPLVAERFILLIFHLTALVAMKMNKMLVFKRGAGKLPNRFFRREKP